MVALHQGLICRDSDPSFATCSINVISVELENKDNGTGGAHVDKKTIIIIIIVICKLQTDWKGYIM